MLGGLEIRPITTNTPELSQEREERVKRERELQRVVDESSDESSEQSRREREFLRRRLMREREFLKRELRKEQRDLFDERCNTESMNDFFVIEYQAW